MTRRLIRTDRDAGVTLPELLVTMFVLAIVSTLVVSFVVAVSRTFTRDREASDSTMVAANGMNELTRVIRSGTPLRLPGVAALSPVFISATPNEMTLYTYIDTDAAEPKPIKARFSIDGQRRLVETRWQATSASAPWTFSSESDSGRTVARTIPADAPALFEYLDNEGDVLDIPTDGFTETQLRSIAAVRVTLEIQSDANGRAAPVRLQNAVGIPNLGISRVRP